MSRDDIIRMAREAGFVDASFCRWSAYTDDLERFAALVAALSARRGEPACPHIRSSGPADRATHWCALAATPPAAPEPEPVATVTSETGADISMSWWHAPALPVGTKLYTAPPAAPQGAPVQQWRLRGAILWSDDPPVSNSGPLKYETRVLWTAPITPPAAPQGEPVAWIDGSGHPRHLSYRQSAQEHRLYGPLRPLVAVDIKQPAAPSVPTGWRLVPVQPTEEMLAAAHDGDREYTLRNFGDVMTVQQSPYDHWVAMVAAAPSVTYGSIAELDGGSEQGMRPLYAAPPAAPSVPVEIATSADAKSDALEKAGEAYSSAAPQGEEEK